VIFAPCAAARGWSVACSEADARVGSTLVAVKGIALCVEVFGASDLDAFFDDTVGSSKVFVYYISDDSPAIGVACCFALVFQVLEDIFAVLLDAGNVAEEGTALG